MTPDADDWFRVSGPGREFWLYLPGIVAVEVPTPETRRREGWIDGAVADVRLAGRPDVVPLDAGQWEQLRRRLGLGT